MWLRAGHIAHAAPAAAHELSPVQTPYCRCRYDTPEAARVVLREVKHMEGSFEELRRAGAPDQGSGAYADVDTTSQMFAVGGVLRPGGAAAGAGCAGCGRPARTRGP